MIGRSVFENEKAEIASKNPAPKVDELTRLYLPRGISIQKLIKLSIGVVVPFEWLKPVYKEIFSRLKFASLAEV